jgi:hypothetical protein
MHIACHERSATATTGTESEPKAKRTNHLRNFRKLSDGRGKNAAAGLAVEIFSSEGKIFLQQKGERDRTVIR